MVWLNPNFLLLSYSIPWKKGTMKGSLLGHSKQRRKPVCEGSHSALIFSNEGTSLIWVTHMGPSTRSTNPSVQDVTIMVAVGLEFLLAIWSEDRAVTFPVGNTLALFPQMPHYSDTVTDLYAYTSGFEDWAIS